MVRRSFRFGTVISDGIDGATIKGILAEEDFLFGDGLAPHEGVGSFIVSQEYLRSSFPAEIAVDALIVYVVVAGTIVRESVFVISHETDYGRLLGIFQERCESKTVGKRMESFPHDNDLGGWR